MSSLKKFLDLKFSPVMGTARSAWLPALALTLCISAFEFVWLESGFIAFISGLVADGDALNLTLGIIYAIAGLYITFIFFCAALASSWWFKPVYIVVFAFISFVEYGYLKALGRFTIFYDIVSAMSATPQQTADSIYAYLNPVAVVPVVAFISACVFVKSEKRFGAARLVFVFIAIALFHFHLYYVNNLLFGGAFVHNSLGSFGQTATSYLILNPLGRLNVPKRSIIEERPAGDTPPANNIVFIFDESIRADHLSLNGYSRDTTPFLKILAEQGTLLNWGTAVSASTISHPSYDAMIAGATPDMIEALDYSQINSLPTLFQYAKAMNYKTWLIDGQMKQYWGGNPDDLAYIDGYISMEDIGGPGYTEDWERGSKITGDDIRNNALKQWDIDGKVAGILKGIYSGSAGNFIFVYKRGAHFPYEKNYPESSARWTPIYRFTDQYEIPAADKRDSIVNSYDNVIAYNLDAFFQKLSPDFSGLPNHTMIIYTADHGESFFADGKAGHGGVTREEANVPLFMLGLKDRNVDVGFKACHANIFSALLDLMHVPPGIRKQPYAISLFDGRADSSGPRFYNPPSGKKHTFD